MAKTINSTEYNQSGRRRVAYLVITLDNSYATGGYAMAASEIGFNEIRHASIFTDGAGYIVDYDYTNKKIKLYASVGTEVTATTDLSAVKLRCRFEGV